MTPKLICIIILNWTIVNATANSFSFSEQKIWNLLSGPSFTPRHSHATCVFKCPDNSTDACIWLTGGYSKEHRTFNLVMEHENSDVWWSKDGASWTQVTELFGNFIPGIGNGDAKVGGYVAPWYSRYGHTLNAMDADGDGYADIMILAAGFAPLPSNDVWLSKDGISWHFEGDAPWPKRAYHGAAIFRDKLWILGGSPLSNDAWVGSLKSDASRQVGFRLEWEQKLRPNEAPWTPRSSFCTFTQFRQATTEPLIVDSTETGTEYLFLLGGLALSPDGEPSTSDGTRTRNDVWKTLDGISWEKVLPSSGEYMPWGARAFHGCISVRSQKGNVTSSRIVITGGGYMGRRGNNDVRELEVYTDMWVSLDDDATNWVRVNHEEGSRYEDNVYSSNEWTQIGIGGRHVYRGNWGHTLVEHVARRTDKTNYSQVVEVPSLLLIGGKVESEHATNRVFELQMELT